MMRRAFPALAAALLVTGCGAHTKLTPFPFPIPPDRIVVPIVGERGLTEMNQAIVGSALSLQGTPYRNGGGDRSGFDCSGFVQFVFALHGQHVSRSVTDLFAAGERVPAESLMPGDLVFFTTIAREPSHVGIAIGDGTFVHAPSSNGRVRIERLEGDYWAQRYVGARRLRLVRE
jgi:hypothetical protein